MEPAPVTKSVASHAFLGSVAASLLLFVVLSWPLARFAGEGIPSAVQNHEQPAWR